MDSANLISVRSNTYENAKKKIVGLNFFSRSPQYKQTLGTKVVLHVLSDVSTVKCTVLNGIKKVTFSKPQSINKWLNLNLVVV